VVSRSSFAIYLFAALGITASCKPSGLNILPGSGDGSSGYVQRTILPLPELSSVSSLIVMSFKGDIAPDSVTGYVLGFPDNLKLEATHNNKFFIRNAPDGDHKILITAQTITGQNSGILLQDVKSLRGTITEMVDIAMAPTVKFSASVKNAHTNQNLSFCKLTIPATRFQAECNQDGSISIENIPFGRYSVEIASADFNQGFWNQLEISQTDNGKSFFLVKQQNDPSELLVAEDLSGSDRLQRIIAFATPKVSIGRWVDMKVAVNTMFNAVNWEPLQTSFAREIITKRGANRLAIKLRDNNGNESAPAYFYTEFEGEIPLQKSSGSVTFSQITREVRQVQVKQGSSGASINQVHNVTAMGIVDIVVVVDNSGSMKEEQTNLSSRMSPLLSAIRDSDWRMVVVSTDANNEYFRGPISKSNFNVENIFANYVMDAGVNGSGLERPILRAVDALRWRPLFGGSWLRQNSTVAVVILTDEDNCHIDNDKGYGCSGFSDASGTYLTNYLSSIRTVGTDARVYGIFWHPSQAQSQCTTALKQANIIAEVVQHTGGTWGSICDADYSTTLTKISNDIAKILKSDFVLSSLPDPGTFKMTVNGQPWTDYQLSGLQVRFTRKPPVGSAVRVEYRSGASGVVTNRFDCPEAPADGTLTATINGQPAGAVTYDSATGKVVFARIPAENSEIIVSYRPNTPLHRHFNLPAGIDPSILLVFDGADRIDPSEYSYNSNTGGLTFVTAPADGSQLRAEWGSAASVTPVTCNSHSIQHVCSQYTSCVWNGYSCINSSGTMTGTPYPTTGNPYLTTTGGIDPTRGAYTPTTGTDPGTLCTDLAAWQCMITQGCRYALYPNLGCTEMAPK
jgi:hypothetical protein